jgi:hypothetical protein
MLKVKGFNGTNVVYYAIFARFSKNRQKLTKIDLILINKVN